MAINTLEKPTTARQTIFRFAGSPLVEPMLTGGVKDDISETILPSLSDEPMKGPFENTGQILTNHVSRKVEPLISLRPQATKVRKFGVLQTWEGVITEIAGDTMVAHLRDLTDLAGEMEVVEFESGEIPDEDRPLAKVGGVFYWSVGYETRAGGQIVRTSQIRFRRTRNWSRNDIERIEMEASQLQTRFTDAATNPA